MKNYPKLNPKLKWEIGAPINHHCVSVDCDYDSRHDYPAIACWTLLNPADGGDPLFYCDDCHNRMEEKN